MTYTLPVTIRRSYLGLFLIFFAGAAVEVFLIYVGYKLNTQQHADPIAAQLAMFMAVVVMLVTLVSMYVYWGAKLVMTAQGVTVLRYTTLFISSQTSAEWKDIEDVTVEREALQTFTSVGDLTIQTAGTLVNLKLTWMPDANKLQQAIMDYQNQLSPTP